MDLSPSPSHMIRIGRSRRPLRRRDSSVPSRCRSRTVPLPLPRIRIVWTVALDIRRRSCPFARSSRQWVGRRSPAVARCLHSAVAGRTISWGRCSTTLVFVDVELDSHRATLKRGNGSSLSLSSPRKSVDLGQSLVDRSIGFSSLTNRRTDPEK